MKYNVLFQICALLLLLSSCSTVQVSQDYDTELDFPQPKSFNWMVETAKENSDIKANNPLLNKRFSNAITRVLKAKGYQQEENADFLVSYDYSVSTKVESDPFASGVGFGFGGRHHFGGVGINTGWEVQQYEVGMLVIDFYSAESKGLFWRGRGSEVVETHSTPEHTTQMANRLVEAILAQFPPE